MDYDAYTGGEKRDRSASDERGSTEESGGAEEHRVSGDQLLRKVKELIREGNVRRITIRNDAGRTILEIPLALGLVGAALAPTFAAVGAVAALVSNCSIVVERAEE